MALKLADRVLETTTTSGTGTLSLLGAVSGYQSFVIGIGSTNTTYYTIYDQTAQLWEVGIGTVTAGTPNTLSRDTVLSNSSGTTSPIALLGNAASVWGDYPAEKSVYTDALGNVSPLGTITSAVWNASTIPVLYGGTGVTTSTGPNSVVLRDAYNNVTTNNVTLGITATTSSGGTVVLTEGSAFYQKVLGTSTETFQLPQANLLTQGFGFIIDNDSTGAVTVIDNASSIIQVLNPGEIATIYLEDNSTTAGTWGNYGLLPAAFQFSTAAASFGNTPITNAIWNGTTIGTAYGGTGLTSFGAANYALYSTSTTALTAGTLPVAAGGTGATSLTGYIYGNGNGPFTASTTIPNTSITGLGTLSTQNANSVAITGGSIDGTSIGQTTPALISGTTITATTQFNGPGTGLTGTASGLSIGGNSATTSQTNFTNLTIGGSQVLDAANIASYAVTSATAGTGISVSGATGAVTFTNTGIISASAGTGISVSGTNPLTISNTGVTALTAGTGISLSGSTGSITVTNTAPGTTYTGGTGVTVSGSTISIGQDVSTTASPTFNHISLTTGTVTPNTSGVSTGFTVVNGDLTAYRSGGTTGVIYLSSSGSNYLYWDGTNYNLNAGNLVVTGNVTAYSDERLKSNIKTIENALEKTTQLRGVTFEKDGKNELGVIAQEVQKIIPEVVIEGVDENKMLSVAYGNIVGVLIEAIKELKTEVDQLKLSIDK